MSLSPEARGLSARLGWPSSYHRLQARQSVGLSRRFVDANAADPREAHGETRLVPCALVDRIERDFEYQGLLNLAYRPEALDRVPADPPVEPAQLLVGETEISFADRQQLRPKGWVVGPAAEGVIAVITRAFSRPALGVHENAVGGQRIALPFVPQAGAPPGDVGAVAALEHNPLDGHVAGVGAQILELVEVPGLDQLRNVKPFRIEALGEVFDAAPTLFPREPAQIFGPVEQDIVEPHECGVSAPHLLTDVLAAEALLKRVEARRGRNFEAGALRLAADEQLAVEHCGRPECLGDIREAR